jgi:hypothetical protein
MAACKQPTSPTPTPHPLILALYDVPEAYTTQLLGAALEQGRRRSSRKASGYLILGL